MEKQRSQRTSSQHNWDDSMSGISVVSSATSESLLGSPVPSEPQPGSSHDCDIAEQPGALQVHHGDMDQQFESGSSVGHGQQMARTQRLTQRQLRKKLSIERRASSANNPQLQRNILERIDKLMQYFQENDVKGEDDYFCMSLALSLKRITDQRKKAQIKVRMMQILEEFWSDED